MRHSGQFRMFSNIRQQDTDGIVELLKKLINANAEYKSVSFTKIKPEAAYSEQSYLTVLQNRLFATQRQMVACVRKDHCGHATITVDTVYAAAVADYLSDMTVI